MENQKSFFNCFGRRLFHLLVLAYFCLTSCSDEMERSSYSSCVSFNPIVQHSCLSMTRSSTDIPSETVTSLLMDGENSIYLHTFYTDNIIPRLSTVQTDGTPVTRALPIDGENMYPSFAVSAYSYIGSWNENQGPNFMCNIPITKSGNFWSPASDYYWPGGAYKMKFFAYAPNGNAAYQLSGQVTGDPTITCTIPAEVTEQKDLLVAGTGELNGNLNSVVNLTFQHALTAVRFVCGDDMLAGTVKRVTLKNICSNGIYNMETGEWSSVGTKTSFSQDIERQTNGTAGDTITIEPQTFMMIPQILSDSAAIEIIFNDGTQDHTLKADIKNSVWPKGKTVTYKISTSSINWEYTLSVTPPSAFTHVGGTNTYGITSYRTNTVRGIQEPVAWAAEFSTDEGKTWNSTKPEWLTTFTTGGDGSISMTSYEASVSSQVISPQTVNSNIHVQALRSAMSKGTAKRPYNLSNSNGDEVVENTANCYVVSAPGIYSFPLVYGNAIKNKKPNTSAYISNIAQGRMDVLYNFLNHRGNITDPYINNNAGCEAKSVELVWQDALNLVTDLELTGSGESAYVSFCVNEATIQQGNAVVAVKDAGGTVLWSWHIWVTDTDIEQTKRVVTKIPSRNNEYEFMPVNLGWCDAGTISYARRTCLVKITPSGGTYKTFTIIQQAADFTYRGNSPYYQWGRKDPFLPSNGFETNTNKTWYNTKNVCSTDDPLKQDFSNANEISACIQNPGTFNTRSTGALNLWDIDHTGGRERFSSVKTIYDPSPVGFQIPSCNAFTCFSLNGAATIDLKNIYGTWSSGWRFLCKSPQETIFFPMLGSRHQDSFLYRTQNQGRYWGTYSTHDTHGGYFLLYKDGINPFYGISRQFALCVRPIKEEP
ncbi:fimbrillin family protein [uncultured Parabacteroides sp.]|uniref:fimbrillin family protein n=1 Tax=uncultured Parabacteroides sp. TaxID=512312 RepID=UPI002632BCCC|nr:fimbrillin family protein [uncultured Parabacteroides sp.]